MSVRGVGLCSQSRGGGKGNCSEALDSRFAIADAKNRIEAIVIGIRRWKLLQRGKQVHCRGDNNSERRRE